MPESLAEAGLRVYIVVKALLRLKLKNKVLIGNLRLPTRKTIRGQG